MSPEYDEACAGCGGAACGPVHLCGVCERRMLERRDLAVTRDADGVSRAILAYARSIAPEAAVIVYVSMPDTKIEDGFAAGVDMLGADHHDAGDAITLLAQWLADNVEQAQEDST